MFDIGWSELLIVLVVALVVVGPKDLPRLMRMVGRWVGKARAMADQFRQSFDEMARETELDELRKEIDALRRNNPVARAQDELNSILSSEPAAIAAPSSSPPVPDGEAETPSDTPPEPADDAAHDKAPPASGDAPPVRDKES